MMTTIRPMHRTEAGAVRDLWNEMCEMAGAAAPGGWGRLSAGSLDHIRDNLERQHTLMPSASSPRTAESCLGSSPRASPAMQLCQDLVVRSRSFTHGPASTKARSAPS